MGADDYPRGVYMLFVCWMYRAGAAQVVPFDLVTFLVAAFGTGPRTRAPAHPPSALRVHITPGIDFESCSCVLPFLNRSFAAQVVPFDLVAGLVAAIGTGTCSRSRPRPHARTHATALQVYIRC